MMMPMYQKYFAARETPMALFSYVVITVSWLARIALGKQDYITVTRETWSSVAGASNKKYPM